MGGKHYSQKSLENERWAVATERHAQGEWARGIFDRLVGSEVTVATLGRCKVLAYSTQERTVLVQPVEGDTQTYSAPFRAVSFDWGRAERDRRQG